MKLYIKNMVCGRCKTAVETILVQQGLHPAGIDLGEVAIQEESLSADVLQQLAHNFTVSGFELIDDRRSRIIEKIKNILVNLVHYTNELPTQKYSDLIADQLHYDYPYLSKLFSEVEGITIEQYLIGQKIEKIKEYLVYDELTLSQIADRMGYSSVAHLSAQFKKMTGLPPSHFKNKGAQSRKPLDEVGKK